MASNRMSAASDRSKRWSMPALQPLADNTKRTSVSNPPVQNMLPIPPKGSRGSRGSVSGTSYGKTDFGVPMQAPPPSAAAAAERRASRRVSRISKLSDVSEAESEKKNSRAMSVSAINDSEMAGNRRMSTRRMSVADNLGAESERRRSRRMSMMSTNSSINRFSVMSRANNDWEQRDTSPSDAPKSWDDDIKNPVNWEFQKKAVNTVICCVFVFIYALALSIYGSALPPQLQDFKVSQILTLVPYGTFALGLAFGAAFANPFELAYGRKPVFLYSTPFFGIFMIGAGVSNSIIALAVCRFFAALFASPALFLTYTIISDMWTLFYETIAIACFTCSLALGFVTGPILGGVVVKQASWKWTMWVPLICVVALIFSAISMSETQEAAVKRKQKTPEQIEKEIAERRAHRVTRKPNRLHFRGNLMFRKALAMLLAAPALTMTTLYISYTVAVFIILPAYIPTQFGAIYDFSVQDRGLTFAGGAAGVTLALIILFLQDRYVHQPRLDRWTEENDAYIERGEVEVTEEAGGVGRSSWRKGLAVSTRNLGLRGSNTTDNSTIRSDSNASAGSRRTNRSSKRLSGDSSHRRSRHQAFSERNINIAIAVTRFLNSQPQNQNKKIIVERVMVLLKNTDSFTTISSSLTELGLHFEEALLAKVLVEALEKDKAGNAIELYRSRSLHRLAAQAALMGDANGVGGSRSGSNGGISRNMSADDKHGAVTTTTTTITAGGPAPGSNPNSEPTTPVSPTSTMATGSNELTPPPEWRMLPAMLASLLFPGGLFMLAWTLRQSSSSSPLPYTVPCVGLALTSCGAALALFSATAYTMELHPFDDEVEQATAARAGATVLTFVLAAGLSVAAHPLFRALGLDVGLSVLAGVAALLGVVPWVVAFKGAALRGAGAAVQDREELPLVKESEKV